MIQDEYDILVTTPSRVKLLGFTPQKELVANHLLPYSDDLDEESNLFLEQVKINLAKSVVLREIKPACGVWTSRLMKYMRIYGLKFGKEDHIALIKLAYELVLIPDLEPCKVHKFATMFLMLNKKKYLITPEELVLPWRPLYDVWKKIFNKSSTHVGMFNYFASLEASYVTMVKCAKVYFDVNATKEILAEFLPLISPWSYDSDLIGQLITFLPVGLHPKHSAITHELWFDELMTLWDTCYKSQSSIPDIMILFAGLAKKNPGAIDWTPYTPKMFSRFLRSLHLPVSYKDMQLCKCLALDTKQVAIWIVWTICPGGVTIKHLRSFLAAIESYLHSVNSGRWSFKLKELIRKLAREFLSRVRREREKKYLASWENKTPAHYKLRESDINEFVEVLLQPTLQAVYSRSGTLDVSIALHNLATLRPSIVIPPLLENLKTSLTSLTEPHRVTVSMSAIAAVARPLLRGAYSDFPEGPTHVVPLLLDVLPGLDPNDMKKTLFTLHFILIFSWMVPYIDCSGAHEYWPDLTDEERMTCEATAQMEDFVLIFLDRLFVLIESSVFEQARIDTKETDSARSKTDAVMESAISSAATAVLMQSSPKIFREALRKFKNFATNSTFETNVSGSMIGVLLRVFARVNSEATLAAFVPELCEELTELLSSDETLHEENPPRDLVYRLVLLLHVVECDGSVLVKYVPKILPVLDRALKLHSNYALTRATLILNHIFVSLSYIDLKEWRSSHNDYGSAPEKWLPIREWGTGYSLKNTDLKWYVPKEKEAACAQMILDRYLKPEMGRLRQWLSGERPMCRERRLRCFHIMKAVLFCSPFLPPPDEPPISLIETHVPPTSIPIATGIKHEVKLDGMNVRVELTKLLLDVQNRMLADKTDDTRGLEMLIQVWERIVVVKAHRGGPGYEAKLRSYSALDRSLDGRGGIPGDRRGGARLRMLWADASRLQDESRLDCACDAGITETALKAFHALFDLSINTYSSVRIQAQIRLYWMLGRYPYSYRALVPKLVELLAVGGEGDEWHAQHKGALYIMLGPRCGPLIAKQDWEAIRELWPAILKAPLSEKPVILKLEQAFSDSLHRHFPMVNTRLKLTESVVDCAKYFLNDAQLSENTFSTLLKKAEERESIASDARENAYRSLVEEIVDIAEAPNVQWRRLELAMQMLSYCPSIQTQYPPRAVRFMVNSLVHDDIAVRRSAQKLTHLALKQRKRKVKKIMVDPYEVAGVPRPVKHIPGYREDLKWVIYSESNIPETDEDWEKPWLKNVECGFYGWPEKIEVAAPSSEQVFSSQINPQDMEDGERYIYEFFSQDSNVDKLVAFLTVEEKKGRDKFNGTRFSMFRILFSQYGEEIANKFLSHAARCAADTQEAPQRFAAEVAAASLKAPRYWPRQRALAMYDAALDIIRSGLSSVTVETLEDWGTCLATGLEKLDVRRGGKVLKSLLEQCSPSTANDGESDDTSFRVCARLYALQSTLGALTWRVAPLASELLRRLEAAHFLQHPYQNVRDAVGSTLMTIFDTELVFPGGSRGESPSLAQFLDTVPPRLTALYDANGDIVIKIAVSMPTVQCSTTEETSRVSPELDETELVSQVAVEVARLSPVGHDSTETPQGTDAETSPQKIRGSRIEAKLAARMDNTLRITDDSGPLQTAQDHAAAVNFIVTVLRGCMGVIIRGVNSATETQYSLLRIACALAARGPPQPHDELARAADGFLASLALTNHSHEAFDTALSKLEELSKDRSWWARLACLDFAQPLFFYGLPMLCGRPERMARVESFTLDLMRDSRLEVRQSASKLLTGLMHCRALRDEEKTLRKLMKYCSSKQLVERHCGVLGLCAYLASRPYSLGPQLGIVLAELSRHTNAPDPIPATIRTALADFRRTHQDDWSNHREQLTEEELDLLADLTSPPSYCA